mmetsp:Transcript_30630/g.96434  ORF Transcript_30630/g.96434 Transcript_30630/m.96434 type:complete len:214 (-) Transcript_30630:8-649(-)
MSWPCLDWSSRRALRSRACPSCLAARTPFRSSCRSMRALCSLMWRSRSVVSVSFCFTWRDSWACSLFRDVSFSAVWLTVSSSLRSDSLRRSARELAWLAVPSSLSSDSLRRLARELALDSTAEHRCSQSRAPSCTWSSLALAAASALAVWSALDCSVCTVRSMCSWWSLAWRWTRSWSSPCLCFTWLERLWCSDAWLSSLFSASLRRSARPGK